MKPRLAWVTGAGGLIGSYISRSAGEFAPDWRVRALTRAELDLCDFQAVQKAFASEKPELVIHCAAISKSPVCQAQPDLAWRINVDATEHLAGIASEIGFIFFSSDLVFDGLQGNYEESASVNPLGTYAQTKAAAERSVQANPRHTVIRTSLNGGVSPTRDRGFNEQMRLAWQRGESMRLFTDEFRSPISAALTARAVWELVAHGCRGLFHLAGAERLSRWQIGQLMAARWPQLHPQLQPESLREYRGAPRAPDTSLHCAKIQKVLSFRLPGLTEWLGAHAEEF